MTPKSNRRFGRWIHLKWLSVVAGAAVIFSSCGGFQDLTAIERASYHLDRRDYVEAAKILEREHERDPGNRRVTVLLAQANLGLAGFEMFGVVGGITGTQGRGGVLELSEFGVSTSCEQGPIEETDELDFRCLLIRILSHLPDTEHFGFLRAKNLLRTAFPSPETAPAEANFLASIVEISSALGRLRSVSSVTRRHVGRRLTIEQEDEAIGLLIGHVKGFLFELMSGYERASFSYLKVKQHVFKLNGKPLIRVGRRGLTFGRNFGIASIFRFLGEVIHERGKAMDAELNQVLAEAAASYLRLSRATPGIRVTQPVSLLYRTEKALERVMNHALAPHERSVRFDLFEFLWLNPPALIQGLFQAARLTWKWEHPAAMREYLSRTRHQWLEGGRLLGDWERWVKGNLTAEQRSAMARYIRTRMGSEFDPYRVMGNLVRNEVASVPPLSDEAAERGSRLLDRTGRWIAENLWEVQ